MNLQNIEQVIHACRIRSWKIFHYFPTWGQFDYVVIRVNANVHSTCGSLGMEPTTKQEHGLPLRCFEQEEPPQPKPPSRRVLELGLPAPQLQMLAPPPTGLDGAPPSPGDSEIGPGAPGLAAS